MRWLRWIAGVMWIGSWRIVYLEVVRWRHLRPNLRFNPPPVPPGGVAPRPGLPLHAVRVAALLAPPVFVATLLSPAARARCRRRH